MSLGIWWIVDRLSRMLEPSEREAVLGDLAESGETGARALRELLGLALRRQLNLWKDWRPWFALAVAIPGVVLLSSPWFLRTCDLYLWVALNYKVIDPAILARTGISVMHGVVLLALGSSSLVAWAWAIRCVLRSQWPKRLGEHT